MHNSQKILPGEGRRNICSRFSDDDQNEEESSDEELSREENSSRGHGPVQELWLQCLEPKRRLLARAVKLVPLAFVLQ